MISDKVSNERWRFAQERERDYQYKKAKRIARHPEPFTHAADAYSAGVANHLRALGIRLDEDGLVVEVGSGAGGLIWRWPAERRLAIDPLAHFYRRSFPQIQANGPGIVQARGERLPLADSCAALVLSDNVLDHVQQPSAYLSECHRILRPGGIFYMTVDVHHPIYGWAGSSYNMLCRLGLRLNVPAFPNHPFHFTTDRVEDLLADTAFKILKLGRPDLAGRNPFRTGTMLRDTQQFLKAMFPKNLRCSVICEAEAC
jgi:SAM-dependent methyltransferase